MQFGGGPDAAMLKKMDPTTPGRHRGEYPEPNRWELPMSGIWIAPKRTIGRRQFFRRYGAAINYSILASAKANQVEPFAYVRDLLVQLSGHSPPAAAVLLPDVWLTAHSEARRCRSRLRGCQVLQKSKTSDLTAIRHFEFRDEFSGVATRRFVVFKMWGDECW